jgi:hypothetical protein
MLATMLVPTHRTMVPEAMQVGTPSEMLSPSDRVLCADATISDTAAVGFFQYKDRCVQQATVFADDIHVWKQ